MSAKYFWLGLALLANCSFGNSLDGDFDTVWGQNGSVVQRQSAGGSSASNAYYSAALQPDGNLLVAGGCVDPLDPRAVYDACFSRLLGINGAPDIMFGPWNTGQTRAGDIDATLAGSMPFNGARHYLNVDTSGNIGAFLMFNAVWLDPSAHRAVSSLVRTANCSSALVIYGGSVSHDGKMVAIGADFSAPSGAQGGVARLNDDLSYDINFNSLSTCGSMDVGAALLSQELPQVNAVAFQTILGEEKIIVAGFSNAISGSKQATVIRINNDGTVDESFGGANGVQFQFDKATNDDVLNAVAVDAQGRIVVGGYHQVADQDHDFLAARLLSNGALDLTFGDQLRDGSGHSGMTTVAFDLGSVANATNPLNTDEANDVVIQPDGKILMGGRSVYDNQGHSHFAIARLNSSGVLDTSFASSSSVGAGKLSGTYPAGAGVDDTIDAILLAPGNRAYIVGHSVEISGARDFGIARLTLDSLDTVFASSFN